MGDGLRSKIKPHPFMHAHSTHVVQSGTAWVGPKYRRDASCHAELDSHAACAGPKCRRDAAMLI